MLAVYYSDIRLLHVTCAALSGTLFTVRAVLHIRGGALAHHGAVRATSYLIDTTLLLAAVLLMGILHQYPLVNSWLTAKVLLVVLYIVLGITALRWARTPLGRSLALCAALATFGAIIVVAVLHHGGAP